MIHNLNNGWHYTPSWDPDAVARLSRAPLGTGPIRLPHTNIELPLNVFSERLYQFVSSYARDLTVTRMQGRRYRLRFDGVMAASEVYLNGELVGEHRGGYTPFAVDVTDSLRDGHNALVVIVDSTERSDIPPHGFVVDYLTYGGIYREVWLEELAEPWLERALVDHREGELAVRLMRAAPTTREVTIECQVWPVVGEGRAPIATFPVTIPAGDGVVRAAAQLSLESWSLDAPVRYRLVVTHAGEELLSTTFGSRRAEFRPDGFHLNGEPMKLVGLNRHQSFPYVGYAMPRGAQRRDADILKYELGLNVVRSSHYPPSSHFLERCDEIGLLVIEEIPGWQHIGDAAWQDLSVGHVREMILRDYNHPSLIMWGTRINESPDHDEFYQRTAAAARELDATRAIGGVRNFKGSHLFEDVYTYNDFVHRGTNRALERRQEVAKAAVPYLVTEYNGHMFPTKAVDDEPHRIEHAVRHLNVQEASHADAEISGAIGWCMADYNTHKDFGSGDRICYHGVLDMFRMPKYAAGVYAANRERPFMQVLGNLSVGEYPASEITELIVLTNGDEVRFHINDDFIGTFRPSARWSHLPHPPVIVDDFVGRLIHDNEPYSEAECDLLKEILLTIQRRGLARLPLRLRFAMWRFLRRHNLTIDQAAKFYETYVGKWGQAALTYRLEAVRDGEVIAVETIGATHDHALRVRADETVVSEGATWETTRVTVDHVNGHGNPMAWSTEVVTIAIDGPLEVIGPTTVALTGGRAAFWVRTVGTAGEARVRVSGREAGTPAGGGAPAAALAGEVRIAVAAGR